MPPLTRPRTTAQTHFPVYGKLRLFTLVEVAAEFHKVKRAQKNELLEKVEIMSEGGGRG